MSKISNAKIPLCNGLFRSRTDARWSTFLDTLGLSYHYEPEEYRLSMSARLDEELCFSPKFFIPKQIKFPQPIWLETQFQIEKTDSLKCQLFAEQVIREDERMLLMGPIYRLPIEAGLINREGLGHNCGEVHIFGGGGETDYMFCQCPYCNSIGVEYLGRAERIGCCARGRESHKLYRADSPDLIAAYESACMAIF